MLCYLLMDTLRHAINNVADATTYTLCKSLPIAYFCVGCYIKPRYVRLFRKGVAYEKRSIATTLQDGVTLPRETVVIILLHT